MTTFKPMDPIALAKLEGMLAAAPHVVEATINSLPSQVRRALTPLLQVVCGLIEAFADLSSEYRALLNEYNKLKSKEQQ